MAPRFQHESEDITDIVTDHPVDLAELRRTAGWTEVTEEALAEKTVAELKADAEAAGLPTDGNKADLVKTLAGEPETAKVPEPAPGATVEPAVAAPAPKGKTAAK